MNAVIEVDEVRQIVHADPQRTIVAEARAHRLEKRGVDEQGCWRFDRICDIDFGRRDREANAK